MGRIKAWPPELNDDLDTIIQAASLLKSTSAVGLRSLEKGNLILVKALFSHLEDAISNTEAAIQNIKDFYNPSAKGGRPVKWVTTIQEVEEQYLYDLLHSYQRLWECYQDNNWRCVKLYYQNIPITCKQIRKSIEAIPREAYILSETRDIIREAVQNGWD